jgi:hypothetical protein
MHGSVEGAWADYSEQGHNGWRAVAAAKKEAWREGHD